MTQRTNALGLPRPHILLPLGLLTAAALSGCPGPAGTDGGSEAGAEASAEGGTTEGGTDGGGPDAAMEGGTMEGGTMEGGTMEAGPDAGPMDMAPTMITLAVDCAAVCRRPTDAVLNAAGTTIYFTAWNAMGVPGVFSAPASGGAPTMIATGGGLDFPVGLAISDDDMTLFIADQSADGSGTTATATGAVFSVPAAGGTPSRVNVTGITGPTGIAVDGANLVLTGWVVPGAMMAPVPAVVRVPLAGGMASSVVMGANLYDPSDIATVSSGNYTVLDTNRGIGNGQVSNVASAGEVTAAQTGLNARWPGGVASSAGGMGRLYAGWPSDGVGPRVFYLQGTMPTPLGAGMVKSPTGAGRARGSNVYVVADELAGAMSTGGVFVVR